MKYIRKGPSPRELREWFKPAEDGRRINRGYDDMPTNVKNAVKERLLDEQGGLCCYTGMRVSLQNSHIEHFKPQKLCTDHEDVDYMNLLAAYPGLLQRADVDSGRTPKMIGTTINCWSVRSINGVKPNFALMSPVLSSPQTNRTLPRSKPLSAYA